MYSDSLSSGWPGVRSLVEGEITATVQTGPRPTQRLSWRCRGLGVALTTPLFERRGRVWTSTCACLAYTCAACYGFYPEAEGSRFLQIVDMLPIKLCCVISQKTLNLIIHTACTVTSYTLCAGKVHVINPSVISFLPVFILNWKLQTFTAF
jgi:hypothetical protein